MRKNGIYKTFLLKVFSLFELTFLSLLERVVPGVIYGVDDDDNVLKITFAIELKTLLNGNFNKYEIQYIRSLKFVKYF